MTLVVAIAGALVCYAAQGLAGWWAWQALGGDRHDRATVLGAALLVGPGLVTVQMVGYQALGVPFAVPWLVLPWLGLVWATWHRRRRRRPPPDVGAPMAALASVLLVVTLAVALQAFALPIHDGDEVNNFALFAKVFGSLRGMAPERLAHLMEPGHVEYPHLVALNQAWLFAWDAVTAPWTARGFEVLGMLALFGVCAGSFAPITWTATAACVLSVASPPVLNNAVGFADVRLLATFVLLGSEAQNVLAGGDRRAPLRLALVLGTAALTKNEGLAVALGGCLVLLVATVRQRCFARGAAALACAAGMLLLWPAVRAWLGLSMPYVDRALAPPLDVLAAQAWRVVAEFARLMFPVDLPGFLRGGLLFWVAIPLALWTCRRDRAARWLALAWVAHLGLYVYVLGIARPGDLQALFRTAAGRLVLHTTAWPILILARAVSLRGAPSRDGLVAGGDG
ncbi:MAG: hypothetical protein R3F56_14175 [Planctomycetota bacterium]